MKPFSDVAGTAMTAQVVNGNPLATTEPFDYASKIIAYEAGELDHDEATDQEDMDDMVHDFLLTKAASEGDYAEYRRLGGRD